MRKLTPTTGNSILTKDKSNLFKPIITLRHLALLLFITIGSVQYLNAQDYAFVKIEDSRSKPLAVVAGKNYDGHLYHQKLGDSNGDNGLWQFVSTGDRTATFVISKSADFFAGDVVEGATETYDGKNWSRKVPATGDYYVNVTGHPTVN